MAAQVEETAGAFKWIKWMYNASSNVPRTGSPQRGDRLIARARKAKVSRHKTSFNDVQINNARLNIF